MGAEGPRSFSAIIAAKRAEFISYREAITKLAEYTGEALADIAMALKQDGVQLVNCAFLQGAERSIAKAHNGAALDGLLDETIRTGAIPDCVSLWNEPDATADGDGWIRNRFTEYLRAAELPCPATLETPGSTSTVAGAKSSNDVATRWATALRGMASFHLWEAASVLAGIDPYDHEWAGAPEEEAEIRRCKRLLVSAIDAGELPNNTWGSTRDEQEIPHTSLRAWCRTYGYDWPIPDPNPQPLTNVDALAEIERLKAELTATKAELAEVREGASFADNPNWPDELDIAMQAWRIALIEASKAAKKPGVFIREWLDKTYGDRLSKAQVERIGTVANWDKTPGPR